MVQTLAHALVSQRQRNTLEERDSEGSNPSQRTGRVRIEHLEEHAAGDDPLLMCPLCPYGEMADTLRLERNAARRGGSNPSTGTNSRSALPGRNKTPWQREQSPDDSSSGGGCVIFQSQWRVGTRR
jgi:hypothetical protein